VFGGYGNFGKGATITRIVPTPNLHNTIRVKMQLWKIDSWDGEALTVYVDGKVVWSKNLKYTDGFSSSVCGVAINSWTES
jgi:CubicO group peptidase (beta-lactamase class C family)